MGDERSYITAFCRPCQAPRYRSIKPLSRKDEARPELFRALDPEAPAPTEGRATCFLCQDTLVFMADSALPPIQQKSEPIRTVNKPVDLSVKPELFQAEPQEPLVPVPPSVVSATLPVVDVLFELGSDEQMVSFQDYPDAVLFVTNKRVVRVRKG